MNKHIFEIKDFVATTESAKHILKDIVDVLLKVNVDVKIAAINVFVNDKELDKVYLDSNYNDSIPINFIPLLPKNKKEKRTYAQFHNAIITDINKDLSDKEAYVHIIDCCLNLHDIPAEQEGHQTRVGEMICSVTEMMRLLKYPIWFNTASDKANSKFGHYFTKLDIINIGDDRIKEYPECIMYSGNANLDWIIVDNEMCDKKPCLTMNSKYDFDFLSIKELITRTANDYPGYFINMFPTVPLEPGSHSRNEKFDRDLVKYDMSSYQSNIKEYQDNVSKYTKVRETQIVDAMKYVRDIINSSNPINPDEISNNELVDKLVNQ